MNFEKTDYKASIPTISSTLFTAKSAILSLSVLLGACAATGDKKEPAPSEPIQKVEQPAAQKTEQAPAPSAAELMKTLKAPLVEPPEEKVDKAKSQTPKVQVKPAPVAAVKPAPVAPVKEMVKKEIVEAPPKKIEVIKAAEPVVIEKAKLAPQPEPQKIVQEAVVADAQKTASIDAKPFSVSAKKLPFTYDIWTIREGNTPLTKGLVITTPTWEMGKEGYMSQIWLTMMEDQILVNSSSDIETASQGLGIRIDGGELIPFTSIADTNIGVISGKWLDKLAVANKVDIYLGFFPGKKPTSDTFTSDLSLSNLARMVATYRMLNQ